MGDGRRRTEDGGRGGWRVKVSPVFNLEDGGRKTGWIVPGQESSADISPISGICGSCAPRRVSNFCTIVSRLAGCYKELRETAGFSFRVMGIVEQAVRSGSNVESRNGHTALVIMFWIG